MSNIAMIGATGNIGSRVLDEVLGRSHDGHGHYARSKQTRRLAPA